MIVGSDRKAQHERRLIELQQQRAQLESKPLTWMEWINVVGGVIVLAFLILLALAALVGWMRAM